VLSLLFLVPASERTHTRAGVFPGQRKSYASVKLLAGLAYSQNSPGIWFLNAQQWVTHHMFRAASVWDIPLVKPRFGCMTSLDLTTLGYDVAFELNK